MNIWCVAISRAKKTNKQDDKTAQLESFLWHSSADATSLTSSQLISGYWMHLWWWCSGGCNQSHLTRLLAREVWSSGESPPSLGLLSSGLSSVFRVTTHFIWLINIHLLLTSGPSFFFIDCHRMFPFFLYFISWPCAVFVSFLSCDTRPSGFFFFRFCSRGV